MNDSLFYAILWYLTITLVGWLSFPLAFRLLPSLADRGYAASRALGLLLWGYLFWLLGSLGIVGNHPGGLLFALAIIIALSAWALRGADLTEMQTWWRKRRSLVLGIEALFLLVFVGAALVRAANPEAVGTEKPMELAFINAILNSPGLPPHDPWLSGYAISYYYFGYVLTAMLAKITGTPGAMAFNLQIALVIALSAVTAYGVVYNLLRALLKEKRPASQPGPASLLAPIFVLLVSNLEGFLHMLHRRGLFWTHEANGALVSPFWQWLDIKDLNLPPAEPFAWAPTQHWWWWRASRVVQDYNLAGDVKEIIDEFPFFSFLLADLHPHVLAMPFALLVMSLALALFLSAPGKPIAAFQRQISLRTAAWGSLIAIPFGLATLFYGISNVRVSMAALGMLFMTLGGWLLVRLWRDFRTHGINLLTSADLQEEGLKIGMPLYIDIPNLLLALVALGGMAFLNTWDFPFYVALYAGAYALRQVIQGRTRLLDSLLDFIWMGVILGVGGVLLYLPFYLGFSSQAGGLLPNLIYPTRGAHLWIMFAPLLLPLGAFLVYLFRQVYTSRLLKDALKLSLGLMLVLWIGALFLGFAITILPKVSEFYLGSLAAADTKSLFEEAFFRRMNNFGGWLTLAALLTLILGLLMKSERRLDDEWLADEGLEDKRLDDKQIAGTQASSIEISKESKNEDSRAAGNSLASPHFFVLLLALLGTLLVLGPEFFYLRDQFGWRMNTIFKFYFQAWLLWAIAAAYGSAFLLGVLRGAWGILVRLLLLLALVMGLTYPVLSLWTKTNGFQPGTWTLDSSAYFSLQAPDEAAAVQWLQSAPPGIIAEAVPQEGGSYTGSARFATLSGQPNVLGWIGHESQWRGGYIEMGSRQADLVRLYCGRDWEETRAILDQYQVRYVIVGLLERSTYTGDIAACGAGLMENKFMRYLTPVFQQGQVTIYEYTK